MNWLHVRRAAAQPEGRSPISFTFMESTPTRPTPTTRPPDGVWSSPMCPRTSQARRSSRINLRAGSWPFRTNSRAPSWRSARA